MSAVCKMPRAGRSVPFADGDVLPAVLVMPPTGCARSGVGCACGGVALISAVKAGFAGLDG